MTPITLTETEIKFPAHTNGLVENKLTRRVKGSTKNDITGKTCSMDTYDKMLRADPHFLKPVRQLEKRMGLVTPLKWIHIILLTTIHTAAVLYSVYALKSGKPIKIETVIFGFFVGTLAAFGVTGGVHRYWCHRSYKAKLPLQWILIVCYSIAGQYNIYQWVRDHRVHHKYSDTLADPHNANRGFFYSHIGWLMMEKHPEIIEKGSKMDLSDITNDPLVQFHNKYSWLFKLTFCWVLPSVIPVMCWGESWEVSIMSQCVFRYLINLHFTWSVNSVAHLWGNKPYDKNILPGENWAVSAVTLGEGWHNYHHTFPWDYKTSELGMPLNLTTTILNCFAKIGWAYDMKEASPSLVNTVADARGDQNCSH